jgi:kynurenine formamidase
MEKFLEKSANDKNFEKFGHFGTHFDVMNKEFPLNYCETNGKVFDVNNIDLNRIDEKDFIILHTGIINRYEYGSSEYFAEYPNVSWDIIKSLIGKRISIIGIDASCLKNAKEHLEIDQYAADNGTFIIENMDNLGSLLEAITGNQSFKIHAYPMCIGGYSGLPIRVVAEI